MKSQHKRKQPTTRAATTATTAEKAKASRDTLPALPLLGLSRYAQGSRLHHLHAQFGRNPDEKPVLPPLLPAKHGRWVAGPGRTQKVTTAASTPTATARAPDPRAPMLSLSHLPHPQLDVCRTIDRSGVSHLDFLSNGCSMNWTRQPFMLQPLDRKSR